MKITKGQWILERLGYEVNNQDIRNVKINNFDYALCFIYAIISLANAIMGVNSLKLVNTTNAGQVGISVDSIKTILLIIINFIVLMRMNIKLYLECKDKESEVESRMDVRKRDFFTIKIKPLDIQMKLLYYCYVIDIVIFMINIFFFKNGIESSICVLIIVPILVTLFNNFVDIAKRKYAAKEKILFISETLKGVTINDDGDN